MIEEVDGQFQSIRVIPRQVSKADMNRGMFRNRQ